MYLPPHSNGTGGNTAAARDLQPLVSEGLLYPSGDRGPQTGYLFEEGIIDRLSVVLHINCILIHQVLTIDLLYGYCGPMIKTTYTAKHHHHNVLQP